MRSYLSTVKQILSNGEYKPNRTGVSGISSFGQYTTTKISLDQGFPLITTKDLGKGRWQSIVAELIWFLSGDTNIGELQKYTKIWNAWADEKGDVRTAYGRFWRRFPTPDIKESAEAWINQESPFAHKEDDGSLSIDQIAYVQHELKNNPDSRRMVVSAWHPGNAINSILPPCHLMFISNVSNGNLNLHLTQRSADIALGVPFNIASYALLAHLFAKEAGLKPKTFAHTMIDAHAYVGIGDRARFYQERLPELQERLRTARTTTNLKHVRDWHEREVEDTPNEGNYDHVPGLLEQLTRNPRKLPRVNIPDIRIDDLVLNAETVQSFKLTDYNPHPAIRFGVAV